MLEKRDQYKFLKYILVFGLAIVFLAIVVLLLGTNAQAVVIVDQAGGGDYLTIQEGVDNAIPGETVYVWDGSYNENITINKPVVLIGNGSATTIIDTSGLSNNAINITSQDVEIAGFNITNDGTDHGIYATAGGFNIHDNLFYMRGSGADNWGTFVDIYYLNPGSTTINETRVQDNTFLGRRGLSFEIIEFDAPLAGSDIVVEDMYITGNNFNVTANDFGIRFWSGINIDTMNTGTITIGDLFITDNNITAPDGLYFWGQLRQLTDVTVKVGNQTYARNNIIASNGIGVEIDPMAVYNVYGASNVTLGWVDMNNNTVDADQNGISFYLYWYETYQGTSSLTLGDFKIVHNTVNAGGEGITFDASGADVFSSMQATTEGYMGKLTMNHNTVTAGSEGMLIDFWFWVTSLKQMNGIEIFNNSIESGLDGIVIDEIGIDEVNPGINLTMGPIDIKENNVTVSGPWYSGITLGENWPYAIYYCDNAGVTIGDITIDDNTIAAPLGINFWGDIDDNDNLNLDIGDLYIRNNQIIAYTYQGIYADVWLAFNLRGTTAVTQGDVWITGNNVTTYTGEGIDYRFWQMSGFQDTASRTNGNVTIDDNTVNSKTDAIRFESDTIGMVQPGNSASHGTFSFSGNTVTSGEDGIFIDWWPFDPQESYEGVTIADNSVNGTSHGIWLKDGNGTEIVRNTIWNNSVAGIQMDGHANGTILNNTVKDNARGFNITAGNDNLIYHNNIINNAIQAFDDGINNWNLSYPGGGNYWSDYTGKDSLSGPNQDIPGSDGLGDTPYDNIAGGAGAKDYYPLTRQVHNLDKDIRYTDIQLGIDDADSGNRLMIHGKYTGGFVVDGKVINIVDSAFDVQGDIFIKNGGSLSVDPTWWNVTGNISVDAASTLILDDTILQMNSSFNGEFGIQVNGTGTMNIQNNSVVKAEGGFPYWFTVMDTAIFSVENSTIRDCGWNDSNPGLWVDADGAYLYNATLTNNYNGIVMNSSSGSQIINCDILSSTNRAVQLIASDTPLISVNINGADNGVSCFQGSSPWIINSTITGTMSNSFILFQNSHPTSLNTTFDKGQVAVTDPLSTLTVKWFLHVYCYDSVGIPVSNAYVNITDSFGTEIPMGQTDAGGWIRWFQVVEYVQGQTFWDSYTPYKIIAEIPAYYGSEMAKMDQSRVVNIMLGLQRVHNIEKDLWYAGIQKAVDDADAGNHIEIYNGTYNETVIVDRALTIMAVYPGNCTVDGNGMWNTFTITAEGVEITGLIIANNLDTFGIYCTAGGFNIHDNEFVVEEIGIGIDLEDIGVDMSGVTSVNIDDMIIDDNDFNSGYMGILVRIQNIGYNLSDNAAVNLGAIYITGNTITTYHGIYMERMENLGYIMSGDSSFTWGGLFVNGNTITCTGQGIYADNFHHWGSYMEDSASFLMGNIEFNNNTIDANEEGINTVRFNYWGEYNYDLSSFQMGDVLVNDNIVNATEKGIVWWDMDHHGNYMYNQSTYVQGDIEFNRNRVNSAIDDGLYIDDLDYWGYYLYGDTVVTIGYVHICDNVVSAAGLGSDGIYLGSASDHGRRLFDNAALYRGDIHVDRNNVNAEGIGIDLDGISYWAWQNNGTTICKVGNYTVNDNTIIAGGDGIEQGNTRYLGRDMFNGSSFTMGNWEYCRNTIQAGDRGIDLSNFEQWGYQMYGPCSVTIGDFLICDNTIDSTLEGINTVNFNHWGKYLYGAASFQIGNLLVNDNIINTTEEGIAWWDMMYHGNYMYNQSTYVQGDIEFNRNRVNSTNEDGLYIDDFDYWGYYLYGDATVTMGHVLICDNVVINGFYGIALGSASDHGRRLYDSASFSRGDIHIDRNDINAANRGLYLGSTSYWGWQNYGTSVCQVGNYTVNDNTIVAGNDGIEQGNTRGFGWEMFNESTFTMGNWEFCRNSIQAGDMGFELSNFARLGYQVDGSCSVTIGDILINDNQIIAGWSGIYLSDSCQQWGSEIFTNSSVAIGIFEIFNNNIDSGWGGINISLMNVGRILTGDSSVDVGMFRILENTIIGSPGIEIRNMQYFGYNMTGNAAFTWGGFILINNTIDSTLEGISTRRFNQWGKYLYGTSSFLMGDVLVNDNVVNSTEKGIVWWDINYHGNYMHGSSSFRMGNVTFNHNNITAGGDGIFVYVGESAFNMFNDTTFTMGDFLIDSNMIDAAGYGVYFEFVDTAYNMYDNATAAFGDFGVQGNDITSADECVYMIWDTIGYMMYNYTSVSIGEAHIENNTLDMTGGGWMAIDSYPVAVGTNMYGNSFLTYGDWYVDGNNITSANGGIYTGHEYCGNELYDSAAVVFHDYYVRNNIIDATNDEGLYIGYYDCGESLHNFSWVVGGNMSVYNNTAHSDNSYGYYMYYNYMGYEMTDDSFTNFGWYDTSHNNFSSDNSNGAYLEIYYLGAFMYGNSQAYLGDITFLYNEFWSGTLDAVLWYYLFENAYYMYDNSFFMLGDVLFNWNYMNAPSGDGVDLDDWDDNGYNMYNSSDAVYGDFEFNNNTLVVGQSGIDVDDWDGWGDTMYGTSTFTMGHIQMNDNNITSGGYGIYHTLAEFANYMEGYSMFWMEDIEVLRNDIDSASEGIYVDLEYFAYYMYDYSSARFGSFLFDENVIDAGTYGMDVAYLEYCAYEMYGNSESYFGDFSFSRNTIWTENSHGIYFYFSWYENGYYMHNNSMVYFGALLINDNNITTNTSGDGIYFHEFSKVGSELYGNSYFEMGNFEVQRNWIDANESGIYISKLANLGDGIYGNSTAAFGDFLFDGNTLFASGDGIYISPMRWGSTMYDNATFMMGDFNFIDNTINANINGIYWEPEYFGAFLYGNSTAIIGNNSITGNEINVADSHGLYTWWWYHFAYEMHDNSMCIVGDSIIMYNVINVTGASIENGIYTGPYNSGENVYDNSTAIFGDYIVSYNTINTTDGDGIEFAFYTVGYNMDGFASVTVGNVIVSTNIINSTNGNGIYIYDMYDNGNELYDNATLSMGSIEFIDNHIEALGGYGIYFEPWGIYGFGSYMYDNSMFEMGDFNFIDNIINAWEYGIYFEPTDFGAYLYGNSTAIIGDNLISGNVIDVVDGNGLYAWWWYYFAHEMYDSSTCIVGDSVIMYNVINVTGSGSHGIYTGPYDSGENVYGNSTAIFGDYIVSYNTINANNSYGIEFDIYQTGYEMYDNSNATFGQFQINDNNITAINGAGLYVNFYRLAYNVYNNSYLSMNDLMIANNIINAQTIGIDIKYNDCGGLHNTSIAYLPSIQVLGNWVDSAINAFNYTTINSPSNNDLGATQVWGDVILDSNDFDAGMFGVVLDWQDPDPSVAQPIFNIRNTNIHDGSAGSTGLLLINVTSVYADRVTIDTFDYGIFTNNSAVHEMFNSTLANCAVLDISLYSDSYLFMVNSTFDNSSVFFEDSDSLLEVGWFMNVIVQSQVPLPIPGAVVAVADVDGTEIFNGTTNANGQAFYIICLEYQENITGIIKNYNDYTANATAGGNFGVAVPDPTMNQTRLVIITFIDVVPPNIFGDNSDTAGTTGDPFYFEINATDDLGIVSVHVNYRFNGVGPYTNLTMSGSGPYWLNEILPPNPDGFIEYYFTAVDSGDFWVNTTPTTAPITDNDPPTIISDNSDTIATTGDTFNFIVDAIDNINISEIHVVWWFGAGAPTNDTMTGIGPYTFSIPVPPDSLDQLHYYFTMNDTSDNWFIGPQVDVNVTDNDAPQYIWVSQPIAGTTGESMLVSIQATDNIDLPYYKIDIDGTLYDLVKDGDYYNYTINVPPDSVTDITYSIVLNDSANNPNNIAPTIITVTDNDEPTYNWASQPTVGTTGESVLVSIQAFDNIDVSYYKIDIDGVLYDMVKDGDYYNYTINIPPDSIADITYTVILNDSANNPNSTLPTVITVTDNDAPTYNWILQPTGGVAGTSVNVSLEGFDNIGIVNATITVNGTTYDLITDGDFYNYTIDIPAGSTANFTYNVTFEDSEGNVIATADTEINVISVDNEAPQFIWILRPTAGTTGDPVLVSLLATDNVAITYYKIDIDGTLYDLVKDGNYYNFTINVPPDNLANITYFVTFNDSANNPNSTASTVVTITDNDAPTYNWILQPTVGSAGTSVDVSLQAFDNIGITNYTIFVNGTPYDMVKDGDYYNFTINIPPGSTADIPYNVTFRDAEGNSIETGDTMITIIPPDTEAPILTWVSQPTTGTTGESVLVSIIASDNIGITYSKIDIDGTLYDLIKDGDYYNFTINIPPDSNADITYSLIFNDSADNPNSTTPTVITVTDNDAPQYIWIAQPTTGTTGESLLVSIQATDNIGVAYYKIDIDGTIYDLIKDGDFYNYTLNIPTDSIANITYTLIFNDSVNNPISTPPTIITVNDNDEPTYVWVLQPTAGTAGDSVIVSLMALDNIGITNYTIIIDGVTYNLVKDGDYYNYTIVLSTDGTTTITYNFTFMDGAANENITADTVITISPEDNEAPVHIWVLYPATGTTGDTVLISLLATDNVAITTYQINIDGTLHDLVKDGDYYNYTFIVPSDDLTDITYFIILNDDANNINTVPDTTITITDNDGPTNLVDTSDTTATTGDTFAFEVNASDNIGIHEVHVVYWFGTDAPTNATMTGTEPFNFDITIPSDSLDTLHYYFTITDEAGNWLVGSQVDISITDNEAATVSNEASDESGKEGEAFTFQIDASDNVGISQVRVAYWFGDDESQKQFITLSEADGTYSGSFTPDQTGTMNYYFEVTDDGGNTMESEDYSANVASAPEEEEEGLNPLFIILPIIVIVLILLFFLLMRKKKEEELPPEVAEGEEEMLDEDLLEGEELEEDLEPEEDLEGELEEGEPGEELKEKGVEFEEGVEEEPSGEFELEEEQGEEPEREEAEEEGGEEFQVEEEPSEEGVEFEEEPAEETEPGDTEDEKPSEVESEEQPGEEPEEKKNDDELDDILNGL